MALGKPVPDTINGTPVWHLEGVTFDTMEVVKKTDAWIHLTDLGDDGWGLIAPEAQVEALSDPLARHGITVRAWEGLPVKPYGKNHAIVFVIITICSFALILLFVMMIILGIILWQWNAYRCRHIRIAPGLRPFFSWTSLKDSHQIGSHRGE